MADTSVGRQAASTLVADHQVALLAEEALQADRMVGRLQEEGRLQEGDQQVAGHWVEALEEEAARLETCRPRLALAAWLHRRSGPGFVPEDQGPAVVLLVAVLLAVELPVAGHLVGPASLVAACPSEAARRRVVAPTVGT